LKDEKTVQQMETVRSCRNLAHRENNNKLSILMAKCSNTSDSFSTF